MNTSRHTIITGTGSYLPKNVVKNKDFLAHEFYDSQGIKLKKTTQEITDKFQEITTIAERRYLTDDMVTSDMAYEAAKEAIAAAKIDLETLDYIIVAHNFGDVKPGSGRSDMLPSLAARVKYHLRIQNPETVAYDLPFGCPGWLQGVIQAHYYIQSGDAAKILVIGAETLSRVIDPHDRDSMLYADGAGAVILEAKESKKPIGIIGHKTRTDTFTHAYMLTMDASYHSEKYKGDIFLKMQGRKLYQYALETVPKAIKACLDAQNISLTQVTKILIHQANGKMDDAILARLYKLYDLEDIPKDVMPMTVSWLGNSSVATLPTLLDLIQKGNLKPHRFQKGDYIVFASVGAGMHINAVVYQW